MREQLAEAARFRRSLLLVVLTVVAPGSGQFMAGNRRLGRAVLVAWAALVVIGGLVLWLVPMDELAGLAVRPWLLRALNLFLVAAVIGSVALLLDAWRLSYPPSLIRRHRLVLTGTTLLMVLVVATPLVVAARYVSAAHQAVAALFPSGEAAAAVTVDSTSCCSAPMRGREEWASDPTASPSCRSTCARAPLYW